MYYVHILHKRFQNVVMTIISIILNYLHQSLFEKDITTKAMISYVVGVMLSFIREYDFY
jgi:hypothetical protein